MIDAQDARDDNDDNDNDDNDNGNNEDAAVKENDNPESISLGKIRPITDESVALAASIIKHGGVIVLPTDTVYGIACDPFSEQAIYRIYALKQRPRYKALQVIMASTDELGNLSLYLPAPLNRLAAAFLPGPFSPIAVAQEDAPQDCQLKTLRREPDGRATQAIRVPNSATTLKILRATGPVAASSANRSGGESPQTVDEAVEAFGDGVDLYLDGGPTQGHVASTVVAADPTERDGIVVLREGVISQARVRAALHVNGGGLGEGLNEGSDA